MTTEVAIVGMGVAVPGASDPDRFWALLNEGGPVFGEPGNRFRLGSFWHPDLDAPDRTYARTSGYLTGRCVGAAPEDDVTGWLRHCVTQAMAGVAVRADDRWSCTVGGFVDGNPALEESALVEAVAHGVGGHLPGDAVDRLRTVLRRRYRHARGRPRDLLPDQVVRAAIAGLLPEDTDVLVVDAACASSLYALDLAVADIQRGDRTIACCGGYFGLGARYNVMFAKLRGLSHTGVVRVFDAAADGTLFSDGAGALVLKSVDRAVRDGDDVLGVIAGTGASADGAGKAIYAPNPHGQRMCLGRAWRAAGIAPGDLDWVVAHGTGTRAGDAAELTALRDMSIPDGLPCSSVKSLVGHTGWSAGVVSVIHALLAMRHGVIPAQRPYDRPSRHVLDARVAVPTGERPFPSRADRPRTVGVSAFGFGGANAHVVLRDRPAAVAGTATPEPSTQDPAVLVGWSAVLPGDPPVSDVLAGGAVPPECRVFPRSEPLPGFAETKLPPFVLRAIDQGQRLALRVTARFAEEHGELWAAVRDTTGVVAAQLGPTRLSMDNVVRCYGDDLAEAFDGDAAGVADAGAFARFLADVRARVPGTSAETAPGMLPNVLAGRIAARHDLHGPILTVDTGATSGVSAVRLACRYLGRGTDLVLVLGVNANSGTDFAELVEVEPGRIAEGAFLLAISRRSTARVHGWPELAELHPDGVRDLGDPVDRIACPPPAGASYLGADGVVAVLRAARGDGPAAVGPVGGPALVVRPTRPLTSRFCRAFEVRDAVRVRAETPAIPPGCLVLAGPGQLGAALADEVEAAGAHLVIADSAVPMAEATRSVTSVPVAHLRVVVSLRENPWPEPPDEALSRLHDLAFVAASAHRERLRDGSCAALVLDPFTADAAHPHGGLFSGLLRAVAAELPGCLVYTLVSDATTVGEGLRQLREESAHARGTPVAHFRAGHRAEEVVHPLPVTEGRDGTPLRDSAVVVAVGGARGITAAVLRELTRTTRPHLWLVGTLDIGEDDTIGGRVPTVADLLATEPGIGVAAARTRVDHLRRVREAAATVTELRARCGSDRVRYLRCDVTDPDEVRAVAERVLATHGRVDLLINSAGAVRPAALGAKPLLDFRAIRDTKLSGYHNLRAAFTARPPGLWWNFGSAVSLLGMPGDADYTAGNEFLALAAEHVRDGDEVTLNWPIWADTGLAADPVSRMVQERLGVLTAIPTAEGTAHAMTELALPPPRRRSVYWLGERELRGLGHTAEPARTGRLVRDGAAGDGWWTLNPTEADHELLACHLVRGRVTAPAAMLLDFAAEAAACVRPGLVVTALSDVRFDRYLRAGADGRLPRIWVETGPPADGGDGITRVRVDIGVTAPRSARRFTCARVIVHLAPARPRAPSVPPAQAGGTASVDPYQDPASPVALSGVFSALVRPRILPDGGSATVRLDRLAAAPGVVRNHVPVVVLDCLVRVWAQTPSDDGTLAVAVPTGLSRLDLHVSGGDLVRADDEVQLWRRTGHGPAGDELLAVAADGRVLLRLLGLEMHVLTRVPLGGSGADLIDHPEGQCGERGM